MYKDPWRKTFMAMDNWEQTRCRPVRTDPNCWTSPHWNSTRLWESVLIWTKYLTTVLSEEKKKNQGAAQCVMHYCFCEKGKQYTCTHMYLYLYLYTRNCLERIGRRLRNWEEWLSLRGRLGGRGESLLAFATVLNHQYTSLFS